MLKVSAFATHASKNTHTNTCKFLHKDALKVVLDFYWFALLDCVLFV